MSRAIVVNLWAGPGAGKSTMAAGVFYSLKSAGYNCELVTEFAKELTWEGRKAALNCQEYITGKQSFRLQRCVEQVDVIITDSPLPLGVFYNNNPTLDDNYTNTVMAIFNQYENYNYFVRRLKKYNPAGRNQTEEQAKEIDVLMYKFMDTHNITYTVVPGSRGGVEYVTEEIEKILRDKNIYPSIDGGGHEELEY